MENQEISQEDLTKILALKYTKRSEDQREDYQSYVTSHMLAGLPFDEAVEKARYDMYLFNKRHASYSLDDHEHEEGQQTLIDCVSDVNLAIDYQACREHINDFDFELSETAERVLDQVRAGGKAYGQACGKSGRAGQLKIKEAVQSVQSANSFAAGEEGQGALFDFLETAE